MTEPLWKFPGDLYKEINNRLPFLALGLSGLLLLDEFIKEGYWFDPDDIVDVGSHESIIVALMVTGLVSTVVNPPDYGKIF